VAGCICLASNSTELIYSTRTIVCMYMMSVMHKVPGIQTKKKAMMECMKSPIGIRSSLG